MKWARLLFVVIGIFFGALLITWLVNDRRFPAISLSAGQNPREYTPDEWIQLR